MWNIGAEGQYLIGALGGAGVAILTQNMHGFWIVPLMIVGGMAAGALWAAPVAWLRNRYGVNEILSSLMLVYVAQQVLNYLVTGPWKDPNGQNFPQTAPFTARPAAARRVCSACRSRPASISRSRWRWCSGW